MKSSIEPGEKILVEYFFSNTGFWKMKHPGVGKQNEKFNHRDKSGRITMQDIFCGSGSIFEKDGEVNFHSCCRPNQGRIYLQATIFPDRIFIRVQNSDIAIMRDRSLQNNGALEICLNNRRICP